MANMRVGESGKRLRIATSFDMSSNTDLSIDFIKGDGSTSTVTATLETGAITMIIDGTSTLVAANESVYSDMWVTDLPPGTDGTWTAKFTYTNTGSIPDDIFIEDTQFTVDPADTEF